MSQMESLIDAATGSGDDASVATNKLAEGGPSAGDAILEAVRRGNALAARRLGEIAGASGSEKVLEAAREFVRSSNSDERGFGFSVLRTAKDGRALQGLVDLLLEPATTTGVRQSIVQVLGELGDPSALEPLYEITRQYMDPEGKRQHGSRAEQRDAEAMLARANDDYEFDRPNLVIAISKACAQLGDHSLAPIPVFFAKHAPTADDGPEAPLLRETSTEALQWVVGDGMVAALREALSDQSIETRRNALDALFYLGKVEVADDLVRMADDEALGGDARERFAELTGAPSLGSAAELKAWLVDHRSSLTADACLRSGKPIVLDAIVVTADANPNRLQAVLNELHVRTGMRFVRLTDAKTWIGSHRDEYPIGALTKAGRQQPLPN